MTASRSLADVPGSGSDPDIWMRWNGWTERCSEPASTTKVSRRSHGPGPDDARISSRKASAVV